MLFAVLTSSDEQDKIFFSFVPSISDINKTVFSKHTFMMLVVNFIYLLYIFCLIFIQFQKLLQKNYSQRREARYKAFF